MSALDRKLLRDLWLMRGQATTLVPKLCLGTQVRKLCFPPFSPVGREAELRNCAFPSRAWERGGTAGPRTGLVKS